MKTSPLRRSYPAALILLVSAMMFGLLFYIQHLTRAAIESHLNQDTLALVQQLFPEASYYTLHNDVYTVYSEGGSKLGYAFYGEGNGFGGEIDMFIGLQNKETIQGVIITADRETPSYFDRLYQHDFFSQFVGLKIADCSLKLYSGLGGKVNAVSGSTISSRGVANGIRNSAEAILGNIIN